MPPKKFGKNWVRIADILLICTNVPRTNVAWTNVTVTMKASGKYGPSNLPLMFGPKWFSNS